MDNVLDGFAVAVARHAGRIAVSCGAVQLSYRELDGAATALAAAAQSRNAGPERPVAILLDRSVDLVVAALAVLKTGTCYLPLDPVTPAVRLNLILADAAPSLVLTSRALAGLLPGGVPVLLVDDLDPTQCSYAPVRIEPNSPAYVIFTSGTTGRPKGVQVSHANLLRLFTTTRSLFGFGCEDIWTLFHSFAFDFSVWEMWGALLYGGQLVVVPEKVAKDPTAFRRLLGAERVTVLNQTPTAFAQLVAADARCTDRLPLKWVVFGGERLQFSDLRRWVAKYGDSVPELINMYGITETTVHASYRRVERADLECNHSLIGGPLPDLDFLLVDENLKLVPDGELGEIIVTGPGVSLGYLGRPELTKQRFVELTDRRGRRVRGYRSGDLAVRTVSGEYEYRGRADDQVKIRGFRIELGEIQEVLTRAPGVAQAVIVMRKPDVVASPVVKQRTVSDHITAVRDLVRGGRPIHRRVEHAPQIVGYVVPCKSFDLEQTYAYLRERLPPYMVPAFVVAVDSIPMNRNGKADLTKLPQPSGSHRPVDVETAQDGDDVHAICALFEEVLGVAGVAADDSFFSVGGDSILALKLRAAGLERGINLELADIYSLHTPRALATTNRSNAEPATSIAPFVMISTDDRESLPHDGIEDAYPIGTLQAGLLFHSAYAADATMYCDIFMFRFGAAYHHKAMEKAIARAIARHEILRTSFYFAEFSEPLQLVHGRADTPLTAIDLRHVEPIEQEEELAAWCAREMVTGYDFRRPPLMRFTVHILCDQEFQLAMSFHDALLDGWSESSLITEILTDYDVQWRGEHGSAPPRPVLRYADFIALEQAALGSESNRQFWSDELAEVASTLLPRLSRRTATASQAGMGFLSVDIDPELSDSLDEVARTLQVSVKHVLLAVHARVLSTLTGCDEVIVGVESNGRVEDSGGTEVIGNHLNVVPYRLMTRNQTWRELITATRAKENELLAVRRFPYAELQRRIGLRELTDISFNYTHFHSYQGLVGTHLTVLDAKAYIKTHFTLRTEFNKDPFTGLLTLDLEANLERVGAEQLQWIGELYRSALASIAADEYGVPTQRALLGERQWQELLAGSRGPDRPLPAEGFFEIFEDSATANGSRLAARCGRETLSYRDLAARVGSLAGWLRQKGARPGVTVGLTAARGLDFLTAVLAIMRAGAVYLPLPVVPAARVASMLVRSGAGLVLCDQVTQSMLAEAAKDVIAIDLADALTAAEKCRPPPGPLPGGRDPAYVIFTSGSTGVPKGALIRHDGMVNHLAAKAAVLDLAPGDRVSQDAAATFDISVWQLMAPLMVGATTVIYPDEISQDPPKLLRALGADGITVLEVSPSVLSVLTSELVHYGVEACAPRALRWLLCSGETLTPRAATAFRRLLPGVRVLNMWGATEVSDDCTHYELLDDANELLVDELSCSVSIGRPIRNAAVYVLDENRELAPLGTPGELYVGGLCVGAGYVHDIERTEHAFVPNPFAGEPGALMYRTGDRGRRGVNGELEFLGRLDRQIKVRGHRLELGEVERALATLTELQDSAVIVRTGNDGGNQLAAFVVAQAESNRYQLPDSAGPVQRLELRPAALRASLAKILPHYAIPDLLIQLDALPRTPHGKVDTTALAGWDFSYAGISSAQDEAPVTPTEAVVIEIWQAALGREGLGPGAHFFEIGGHSLHATQVMARLRDRLAVDLPLRTIFEYPTVRELAVQIDQIAQGQQPGFARRIPRRPEGLTEFPLTFNQAGLWFLNQLDSTDSAYENGTLLRISGPLDVNIFSAAVDTVASRHEILFTRFSSRRGIPFQILRPDARVRLDIETVADGARLADTPEKMTRYVQDRMIPGRFDLEKGPLVIVCLYQFTLTERILDWSSHHIVSDGWSTNVIVSEIRESYLAQIQNRIPRLPELPVQYGDYALWQHRFVRSDEAAQEVRFWSSYLDGYPVELEFPLDFERTDDRPRTAGYVTAIWDGALLARIATFTHARHTTPFMLFHALASIIVAKFAQQSDVVLGAAVAGRSLPDTEHLVGFFAHALPLRYHVDLTSTPNRLLHATTSAALTALEHQHLPLQEIVRALGGEREQRLTPLLQVLVTVDNYPLDLTAFPGLTVSLELTPTTNSLADLTFNFVEGDGLRLTLQYDSSLFTPATAQRLLHACDRLLNFFLEQPDRSLNTAVLLSLEDRTALERIWMELTGTPLDFGSRTADTLLDSPHWPALIDQVEAHGLLPALLMAL